MQYNYIKKLLSIFEENASLPSRKALMSEIVHLVGKDHLSANAWLSWFHLMKNLGLLVLCVVLAYSLRTHFILIFLAPFLIFLEGVLLSGLASIMHDCVHGAFTRSKGLNNAVGLIAGVFVFLNFFTFKQLHLAHHMYNQDNAKDPDVFAFSTSGRSDNASSHEWEESVYLKAANFVRSRIMPFLPSKTLKTVFLILALSVFIMKSSVTQYFKPKAIFEKNFKLAVWHYALFASAIIGLISVHIFVALKTSLLFELCFMAAPVVVSYFFISLIVFSHIHPQSIQPVDFRDETLLCFNVSNILSPWFINFFGNNFNNRHIEHHLMPSVPNYYLRYVSPALEKYKEHMAPSRKLDFDFLCDVAFRYPTYIGRAVYLNVNGKTFGVHYDMFKDLEIKESFTRYLV